MEFEKTQKNLFEKFIPVWAILPLISILALNTLVYSGSAILTASRYHFDLTMAFDRAVPLIPQFIWIYVLAFPFWGVNYLLAAQRGKDEFYRFVATDLTVHIVCLLVFLILPTTNVRPEVAGVTVSEKMLQFIYAVDGGANPSNLLPSIHCYVSWMCYRSVKGSEEIPKWYQNFSLIFALLIIISTQVLKQHYIVDAIAGVVLVEIAWRFFFSGDRHVQLMNFYEKCNQILLKLKK
ncbi:MAG: phosphatase PAP2 family protein [Eubacteriales bacterium]|nr:phosphatase PAP2 family protein [Eubacteriales bacterium]